jgi:putative transposase
VSALTHAEDNPGLGALLRTARGRLSAERSVVWEGGRLSSWYDGTHENVLGAAAESPTTGDVKFVVRRGVDVVEMTPREVSAAVVNAEALAGIHLGGTEDDDAFFASLSSAEQQKVLETEGHLLEVTTGWRFGVPGAGEPDPRYDPAVASVGARVSRKAEELGRHRSWVYRNLEKYEASGRPGLIHGNRKAGARPSDSWDDTDVAIVKLVVQSQVRSSTKDVATLAAFARSALRDEGRPEPSSKRLRQLIDDVSHGLGLYGSAKTRQSKSIRPNVGPQRTRGLHFGDEVEIDSSPLDFFVWCPVRGVQKATVVVAVDVATKLTWCRATAGAPTGRDVALLLHDMINPVPLSPRDRPWLQESCLPKSLRIHAVAAESDGEVPRIRVLPGLIRLDHGKEGENYHFISLCAQVGIDIEWARSMTGPDKAFVESRIHEFARISQIIPGHKGNSVANRGEHPETEPTLSLWDAQLALDEWMYLSAYLPHSGLPHPMQSGRYLTPMQAYNLSLSKSNSLRIVTDVNLVHQFLPVRRGVMSGDGVQIDYIRYWSEDCAELMQSLSQGDARRHGIPLTFHVDPMDRSKVYWHEPRTARWHVLRGIGSDGEALPPFSETLRRAWARSESERRPSKQLVEVTRSRLLDFARNLMASKGGQAVIARDWANTKDALKEPTSDVSTRFAAARFAPTVDVFEVGDDDDNEALRIDPNDWDSDWDVEL